MRFDDIDLLRLSVRERRKLVGHNVSMIFQEPQSCRPFRTDRPAINAEYPRLDL